jgi:hypothetical protein
MQGEHIEMAFPAAGIQGNIRGNAIEPCLRIDHVWQLALGGEGVQKGLLHEVFGKRTVVRHAEEIVQQRAVVPCEQLLKGSLVHLCVKM